MPLEYMESENKYFLRMRGATDNFVETKRVLERLKFEFVSNQNFYSIDKKSFSSKEMMISKIQSEVDIEVLGKKSIFEIPPLPELTIDIDSMLKQQLFAFQRPSVAYMIEKCRAFNADQQGLGKTIQAIAAAIGAGCKKILVITKLDLCSNWQDEVAAWTYRKSIVFRDSIKNAWPMYMETGMADIGIVNFDSLEKYFVQRIKVPEGARFLSSHVELHPGMKIFDCIIVDESHYMKDPATRRTKICVAICRGRKYVFPLSGTPVLNKAEEIYPQLCMMSIEHKFAPDYATFKKRYGGKHGNRKLLNALLHKYCFVRRLKKDVLPDLPEKRRQTVTVDIDNREEYDQAENNFSKYLQKHMVGGEITNKLRAFALQLIMELKKISAKGKLATTIEWVKSMNAEGEKVVVFAHHKFATAALKAAIPGAVSIVGDDDRDTRTANKAQFINDPDCPAIVCSIGAAAEGHTLTVASNLALHELPWHYGKMEQIEDRIHRIGQKNGALITAFLGRDTIDEKIYKLIFQKKELHDGVTGTDEEVPNEIIDTLINLFANRKVTSTSNDSNAGNEDPGTTGHKTVAPPLFFD